MQYEFKRFRKKTLTDISICASASQCHPEEQETGASILGEICIKANQQARMAGSYRVMREGVNVYIIYRHAVKEGDIKICGYERHLGQAK